MFSGVIIFAPPKIPSLHFVFTFINLRVFFFFFFLPFIHRIFALHFLSGSSNLVAPFLLIQLHPFAIFIHLIHLYSFYSPYLFLHVHCFLFIVESFLFHFRNVFIDLQLLYYFVRLCVFINFILLYALSFFFYLLRYTPSIFFFFFYNFFTVSFYVHVFNI